MKRVICIVLFFAIFCSFFVIASADDRIYSVGSGWQVYAYNDYVEVDNPDKPTVSLASKNGFIEFHHESFAVPSGVNTIYGRFMIDTSYGESYLKSAFKTISVCGISTPFVVVGSYLYFSATGDFRNLMQGLNGLSLTFSETLPSTFKLQLDYLYVRTSSFVSLPFSILLDPGQITEVYECNPSSQWSSYENAVGLNGDYTQGNTYSLDVSLDIDPSLVVLDNGTLLLDFQFFGGVPVGYKLMDSYMNFYYGEFEVSCDFLDSQSNWYLLSGEHTDYQNYVTIWRPDSSGNFYAGEANTNSITSYWSEHFSYDVTVAGQNLTSARLAVPMSGAPTDPFTLNVTIYVVGGPDGIPPSFAVYQSGVYLNSGDIDVPGDSGWFAPVRTFFENGISAIVSAVNTGWQKIVDAINPDVDNSAADTITSQAGQVHDFESSQQEVFNQYSPQLTQGLNVSGYSGAFLFVGNFLSDIYGVLGPYQIVITLPICIGIVMFILGRVNGSMIPRKPQKYDKELIPEKKE